MKNSLLIKDFEINKISKEAQKTIMGGDPPIPPEETNNPVKGGGGNGNG